VFLLQKEYRHDHQSVLQQTEDPQILSLSENNRQINNGDRKYAEFQLSKPFQHNIQAGERHITQGLQEADLTYASFQASNTA
jgi:hypothetical protein